MLFNSAIFLGVFLPLCLGCFYLVADHKIRREWVLIAASFVFYGYWDVRLLPLLVGSIVVNWLLVQWSDRISRKWHLYMGVGLNLALIGFFKYFNFFAANLTWLAGDDFQAWSIILPLGISFFTFQQISYLVDCYRRQAPIYGFREYVLYISFFPQLIAGPIVRHNQFIPELALSPLREGVSERLSRGFCLLIIGLTKKLLIADEAARLVDPLFKVAETQFLSTLDAWIAAVAFAVQIYFDFSGYSDMAIGLALMFGISLPFNFNSPYRAHSIQDFWRRWHITLSSFLRDYVYIPLGGSRHGLMNKLVNLMATMLLAGLWHGANWTFVIWGGLHGLALSVHAVWKEMKFSLPLLVGQFLTFLFVVGTWPLFRAQTFEQGGGIVQSLLFLNPASATIKDYAISPWLLLIGLAVSMIGPTSQEFALKKDYARPVFAAAMAGMFVFFFFYSNTMQLEDFIYFQF